MSIVKQNGNGKGSLRDIQILVNNKTELLNSVILEKTQLITGKTINWLSPLANNDFSEYRDNSFLKLLGLDINKINIHEFWPTRGPQWDALGKTSDNEILLVEAKANIPELETPGSKASEKSLNLIKSSLNATKNYLNISNDVDWADKYYQYTNRLAHLYYLRIVKKIPTFLIFIYIIGDKSVNGPDSKNKWLNAIKQAESYLGLENHNLSDFVLKIFIQHNEL